MVSKRAAELKSWREKAWSFSENFMRDLSFSISGEREVVGVVVMVLECRTCGKCRDIDENRG